MKMKDRKMVNMLTLVTKIDSQENYIDWTERRNNFAFPTEIIIIRRRGVWKLNGSPGWTGLTWGRTPRTSNRRWFVWWNIWLHSTCTMYDNWIENRYLGWDARWMVRYIPISIVINKIIRQLKTNDEQMKVKRRKWWIYVKL